MNSHGVAIPIPAAGEEMVPGLSIGNFFFHFFSLFFVFCNHGFIVLGTKTLMQCGLWREQKL